MLAEFQGHQGGARGGGVVEGQGGDVPEQDLAMDTLRVAKLRSALTILGVVIGGIVVSMYLPIFKLGQVV